MLLDDLKKANIEAMKAKDKDARSVISVVLTKCQLLQVEAKANGKEFNDPQVLEVIQKVLKVKITYILQGKRDIPCYEEIKDNDA